MTVLVTGAAGFLGGHVTGLLVARGERPRVLIRPGERLAPPAAGEAEVCVGDIADPSAAAAAVDGVDAVLHCAARTGPWGPAAEYQRVNVAGLETLVRAAMAAGVRRIVHVSSVTVHGNDVGGRADEDAPLRADPNPYSRSKLAGERLLQRLIRDEQAPVTIVRPGWIYGPGDGASFARLARMAAGGQLVMFGPGTNQLPLVYVRDVAEGLLLAAGAPGAVGRAYLLVSDEPVTQLDYLTAIAACLGAPAPTRRIPYRLALAAGAAAETAGRIAGSRRPPPVTRYGIQMLGGENRFTISRARRELGFSPQVRLAEGVRLSIGWYLDTARVPARSGAAR